MPDKSSKLERRAPVADGSLADAKVSPRVLADPQKTQAVFVQLSGRSAAQVNATARENGASRANASKATRERQAQVERGANTVAAAARKADAGAEQLFAVANGLPGVAVRTDAAGIKAMARRSDVVKITPLKTYRTTNASAAQLTQTLKAWQSTGLTGSGVRVGVIDTGIDYTHADFGGEGTVAAFEAADAVDTEPGWETAKVRGGYDFVGDDYNADPTSDDYQPVPNPDPNPLDCNGHGTHVAGTAAGTGVNGNGSTFTGNYRTLTAAALNAMRIGPGTAPKASLYGLRVFGCEGSTNVIMPALDWALDPNGDGDFSDRLHVINMSLGADYDSPDDPENTLIDQLAQQGVLTVNSAGNAGDYTDAGSAAKRALTVAWSVDSYSLQDGLIVNAPADVAGQVSGQTSVAYPWSTKPDVTGAVALPLSAANADGCSALSSADAAKVLGKVAWLEWDDNDSTRRCGSVARSANVKAAGAIGALFTTSAADFGAGITGDATIPVFQLNLAATTNLRPAAEAGTLQVTFTGSLLGTVEVDNPAIVDMLSPSSSRGTRGAPGTLKPDVAAPGQTIISANVGSGNGGSSSNGTSMASPHVAGIAALLRSKYPTWSVEQIKAAIMNTAGHDLYTEPNKGGDRYGPNRVGAGRVNANHAATTQVLAYSTSDPGVVSAGFGVVEAPITSSTVTRTKSIQLRNVGSSTRTVSLSYSPVVSQPGVTYSVSPRSVRIPRKGTKTVKVTMTIKPSKLRRTIDPTMSTTTVNSWTGWEGARQYVSDASGRLLVKPSGQSALRVPVYGAAKPVSVTTSSVGTDEITLKGKGVEQGTGMEQYLSKASLLTLGATSRRMPSCVLGQVTGCALNATARSSDLRYTAAGSTGGGYLWFGVSMWGNASHLGGGRETDIDIDVDGDGEPDYVVAAFTWGDSDQPIALLLRVEPNGELQEISWWPINFLEGDIETNAFDNDSFLVPVDPADIGMPAGAATYPIQYRTSTFSEFDFDGGAFDQTGWVAFDVANPAVRVDAPLYADLAGVQIDYTATAPVVAGDGGKVVVNTTTPAATVDGLVIHLGARTGYRAEVVKLRAG
ncbi:MAG: S8 family serine peptidase [Micropruina sp.]|nr:S8 family serine peptidase [Micropruina sp.]